MDDHEALESLISPDALGPIKCGIGSLRPNGEQHYTSPSTLCVRLRECSIQFICIAIFISGFSLGLLLGSILTLTDLTSKNSAQHPSSIYGHSPAYEAIASRAMIKQPNVPVGPDNPYSGAPNSETDGKWKSLLGGYNIRAPRISLSQDRGPLIPLDDGSDDVWVSFGVYHHLHCLDSLRHQIHGQNCVSRDSRVGDDGFPIHLDHCIETLRQWLMCQPDLTPRSVTWREDGLSAVANNTIVHTCVDWDTLQSWIDRHTISGSQPLIRSPNGDIFDGPWPPPPRCAGF